MQYWYGMGLALCPPKHFTSLIKFLEDGVLLQPQGWW